MPTFYLVLLLLLVPSCGSGNILRGRPCDRARLKIGMQLSKKRMNLFVAAAVEYKYVDEFYSWN